MLFGCEKHWTLSVLKSGTEKPEFCLSSSTACTGDGVQLGTIVFQEVDKTGLPGRQVWMIEGQSNSAADFRIKTLVYGSPPEGWVERRVAEKMRSGTFYSVNEEFYFTFDEQGSYRVLSRAEFFQLIRSSKVQ